MLHGTQLPASQRQQHESHPAPTGVARGLTPRAMDEPRYIIDAHDRVGLVLNYLLRKPRNSRLRPFGTARAGRAPERLGRLYERSQPHRVRSDLPPTSVGFEATRLEPRDANVARGLARWIRIQLSPHHVKALAHIALVLTNQRSAVSPLVKLPSRRHAAARLGGVSDELDRGGTKRSHRLFEQPPALRRAKICQERIHAVKAAESEGGQGIRQICRWLGL